MCIYVWWCWWPYRKQHWFRTRHSCAQSPVCEDAAENDDAAENGDATEGGHAEARPATLPRNAWPFEGSPSYDVHVYIFICM